MIFFYVTSIGKLDISFGFENNNVNMNTRWDYLFQLSKVQQVRKKQKAELKQKENSLNEINMCTFSPKVNKPE